VREGEGSCALCIYTVGWAAKRCHFSGGSRAMLVAWTVQGPRDLLESLRALALEHAEAA